MEERKRILSGIQPTGNMHFGRYFGAVRNWVDLQEAYECYYCVVDYHAMTMPYNPAKLRANSWELIINLLAVGIKPENLFIQSMIPEHTELGWILNCFTSYGANYPDDSVQRTKVPKTWKRGMPVLFPWVCLVILRFKQQIS